MAELERAGVAGRQSRHRRELETGSAPQSAHTVGLTCGSTAPSGSVPAGAAFTFASAQAWQSTWSRTRKDSFMGTSPSHPGSEPASRMLARSRRRRALGALCGLPAGRRISGRGGQRHVVRAARLAAPGELLGSPPRPA